MRLGFKVLVGFTLFSNAWLWVLQEPYPKFANVRWISNLFNKLPHFLHTTQIPWLFEDLLFRQATK